MKPRAMPPYWPPLPFQRCAAIFCQLLMRAKLTPLFAALSMPLARRFILLFMTAYTLSSAASGTGLMGTLIFDVIISSDYSESMHLLFEHIFAHEVYIVGSVLIFDMRF